MRDVESVHNLCTMGEISCWFPTVVSFVIALPLDEVLKLVTEFAAVENFFRLIFDVVFDFYWFGWRWIVSLNVIAFPRGEAIDVKDRVLPHSGR
jgi:hypothetical protein